MANVGRYTSPLQIDYLKRFVNGELKETNFFRSMGENDFDVSIADLLAAGGAKNEQFQIKINNYFTDPESDNFVERAFIWGNTHFELSAATRLVSIGGELSVVGAAMVPRGGEQFGFTSDSTFADLINIALEPLTDPYGIGRVFEFTFSEAGKVDWASKFSETVLSKEDFETPFYVEVMEWLEARGTLADYTYAATKLKGLITEASEYQLDGYNIIYGSNGDDFLSEHNGSSFHMDITLPTKIVGGEGDDNIDLRTANGIAYGGDGDDKLVSLAEGGTLYGGDGDDKLVSLAQGGTLYGGDGSDHFEARNSGSTIFGEGGSDTYEIVSALDPTAVMEVGGEFLADWTSQDRITFDGQFLTGDQLAVRGNFNADGSVPSEYRYFEDTESVVARSADRYAVYDVLDFGDSQMLLGSANGGWNFAVSGYSQGVGGLSAKPEAEYYGNDYEVSGGLVAFQDWNTGMSQVKQVSMVPIPPEYIG